MDEEWKQARRDELWDTYVYGVPSFAESGIVGERATKAIEVLDPLRVTHVEALDAGNARQAALVAERGRVVWQLLSIEIGNWLLTSPTLERSVSREEDWRGKDRAVLRLALSLHERAAPEPHRSAIDPECVLLPRWLVHQLSNALAALDEGEVHELVSPIKSGRHDDAWSWDKMRACAVEHVAYLRGQGFNAETARKKVAIATSVPEKTLRDWESDKKFRSGCEIAFEAGKMKRVFADMPDYEGIVDTLVLARLKRFDNDPSLLEFGRQYRGRFGRRHNRDPSAGN